MFPEGTVMRYRGEGLGDRPVTRTSGAPARYLQRKLAPPSDPKRVTLKEAEPRLIVMLELYWPPNRTGEPISLALRKEPGAGLKRVMMVKEPEGTEEELPLTRTVI
jgi:hypothetical protein